jgi:hypothetical protein
LAGGVIAIHSHQQSIAKVARGFQVSDVAGMQDIEAAVGYDQFFPAGAKLLPPFRQFVPGDDFIAKVHAAILPARKELATLSKHHRHAFAKGMQPAGNFVLGA